MSFTLKNTIDILERTPTTLIAMLEHLSTDWTMNTEGGDSWSVYDIVGHLLHCEKSDWLLRAEIILSENSTIAWEPFDRFAQFEESKGKSLGQLLMEFTQIRTTSIKRLKAKNFSAHHLATKGMHPVFREVTLSQLLSTWAVHDLNHIGQITRVMAKQYESDVGPWKQYLGILNT